MGELIIVEPLAFQVVTRRNQDEFANHIWTAYYSDLHEGPLPNVIELTEDYDLDNFYDEMVCVETFGMGFLEKGYLVDEDKDLFESGRSDCFDPFLSDISLMMDYLRLSYIFFHEEVENSPIREVW